MIDNSLWEILVTFDQCGTLSAAAEKLYVSQPALSAAMKKLEKELGVSLFERSKNRLILNEVGHEAVRLAKRHIDAEKEMCRQLQEMSRRLSTVTAASYVSGLLKMLVNQLRAIYPEKTIVPEHVSSEMLPRGLLDGTFDYVVTEYPIDEPEIVCIPFLTDRLMVRLTKNDPLAEKSSLTKQDIRDSKLLVWTQSGFWASFVRKNFPDKSLVFVSDEQEYYELIRAFGMRSFTLESIINTEHSSQYRFVPLAERSMQVTFYLCCLKHNEHMLQRLLPEE